MAMKTNNAKRIVAGSFDTARQAAANDAEPPGAAAVAWRVTPWLSCWLAGAAAD